VAQATNPKDVRLMGHSSGVLRIGEVSRRTGVAVPTLRAWERRYQLLDPDRTEGGHRLYGERDIDRVRAMMRLLDEGWSAAAAARQVSREPATVTPLRTIEGSGEQSAAGDLIDRLEATIAAFDAAATDSLVDDVFARFDVPRALDEVLLPVMRRIGEGWEDDPRLIAREHFATNTLRPRLQRLLRSAPTSARRSCVAAAPEGEDHDLGLLAGCAVVALAGWRIHYLGIRTPTIALERGVTELRPDAVMIGSMFREHSQAFLADTPDFGSAAVVLGGAGFSAEDATRLPNAVVHVGPLSSLADTFEHAMRARDGVG
jgi:MerR family transcriptional regulator, light-induced transcriptional regulator